MNNWVQNSDEKPVVAEVIDTPKGQELPKADLNRNTPPQGPIQVPPLNITVQEERRPAIENVYVEVPQIMQRPVKKNDHDIFGDKSVRIKGKKHFVLSDED